MIGKWIDGIEYQSFNDGLSWVIVETVVEPVVDPVADVISLAEIAYDNLSPVLNTEKSNVSLYIGRSNRVSLP